MTAVWLVGGTTFPLSHKLILTLDGPQFCVCVFLWAKKPKHVLEKVKRANEKHTQLWCLFPQSRPPAVHDLTLLLSALGLCTCKLGFVPAWLTFLFHCLCKFVVSFLQYLSRSEIFHSDLCCCLKQHRIRFDLKYLTNLSSFVCSLARYKALDQRKHGENMQLHPERLPLPTVQPCHVEIPAPKKDF